MTQKYTDTEMLEFLFRRDWDAPGQIFFLSGTDTWMWPYVEDADIFPHGVTDFREAISILMDEAKARL